MHLYRCMGHPMLPVDSLALHLLGPGQTRPPDPRSIQRLLRALDTPDYAYGSLIPIQVRWALILDGAENGIYFRWGRDGHLFQTGQKEWREGGYPPPRSS